ETTRDDRAALRIELARLAEIVRAIEKAQAGRMRGRHRAELLFELQPHGHRVDAEVLTGQTREEQFPAVLAFEGSTEGVGHLEPSLVIDACRRITPKHARLLHF